MQATITEACGARLLATRTSCSCGTCGQVLSGMDMDTVAHGKAQAMESSQGATDLSVSEVGVGARAARDVTQDHVTHEHVRQENVRQEGAQSRDHKEGKDLFISTPQLRMTLMDLKCQRGRGRNAPHVLLRII
jgi:hypothetical protein